MNIVLDKLTFSEIKDFTDYLVTHYEQDDSLTDEVHLSIDYDAVEPKNNMALIHFLAMPERARIYKLQLISPQKTKEQTEFNLLLEQTYTAIKQHSPVPIIVRKAKRNWLEGKKVTAVGMQPNLLNERAAKSKLAENDTQSDVLDTSWITAFFNSLIEEGRQEGSKVVEEFFQTLLDKTTAVIQERKKEVPSIISFFTLLLKKCGNEDIDELILFNDLVNKCLLANDHNLALWIKILSAFMKASNSVQLKDLSKVLNGLEKQSTSLNALASLFDYPPYPKIEQFINELAKDKKNLKSYMASVDKDPKGIRAAVYNKQGILIQSKEQILDEQFDTSKVRKIITKIQSLVEGADLTSKQQYDLAQQIIYINAIGKDHPVSLKGTIYKGLTHISRAKLRELSDALIAQLRDPVLSEQHSLQAQLNLLALMREQYFRSTGEFIQNSQMISVLMSLNNQQHHMLLELQNKEEKRSTTSLLAAMQWVLANGSSVDVCVSGREQLVEDYKDNGTKDFFAYLGIPSAEIKANDPSGTYLVSGINYSTVADLAEYRLRALEEGEDLSLRKSDHQLPAHLIINGANFSDLDDKTYFFLADKDKPKKNSYAWIYPLINEFIEQEDFRRIGSAFDQAWSEAQDLIYLRAFLDKNAPDAARQEQLKALTDDKFSSWINAACSAQQLVEGEDFIISSVGTHSFAALPVYQKLPQEGFEFSKGLQQFLHARLQKMFPGILFKITTETETGNFFTAKKLIDVYRDNGSVVGIFDQLGTRHNLLVQRTAFEIDHAYQLPAQKKVKHTESSEDLINKINDLMARAIKNQPIVLLAKDAHQVEELFKKLSQHFVKAGTTIEIGAFSGNESKDVRQQWGKEKSGLSHTITIATTSLIKDINFNTEHEKGFLVIQTELDSVPKMKRNLGCFGSKGKPNQFVAVYENNGSLCSSSWFFKTEEDKKIIIDGLGKIQSKKNEDIAVERYYNEAVFTIQQTVLKQFDQWTAFLHLIYPANEWKKIENELLVRREELFASLAQQWITCLEESDPEKTYYNPYARRGQNQKLQTSVLNHVLKDYENVVDGIWKSARAVLKEKTDTKIIEGSVNALRCKYLEGVELHDQLQLNKLTQRQNKKTAAKERKSTNSYLDSGLDVNGAMLAYANVPLMPYKLAFAKSQLKLLAKDLIQEVNNSSLSGTIRSLLIDRAKNAGDFLEFELIFKDFNRWLGPDKYAEKYRMQPIVRQLIRVYEQLGLPHTDELKVLKETYIDHVALEIVNNLESNLSWAIEKNQGLGYWLERSAVKSAATELLNAVDLVKEATDTAARQLAIKNLYKVLAKNQAKLDGLWIFSFGHTNTRDLINKTLKTLDGLSVIGSEKDQLDNAFIQKSKEEAYAELMKEQFNTALQQLEKQNSPWLNEHPQWQAIKEQMKTIQNKNNTVYALDELYYFLSKTARKVNRPNEPLFKPVIELRGTLRTIWNKSNQNHQDIFSQSKYFEYKAESLHKDFQGLTGFALKRVHIKPCHTGFSEYFDLIVEGSGSVPIFDSFIHYDSQISALTQENNVLVNRCERNKTQLQVIQKFQRELLPLLKSSQTKGVDIEVVPEHCLGAVREIHVLKELLAGKLPDDLNAFSQKTQDLFLDRHLLKTFDFMHLQLGQIKQLKDKQLKADFIELYNKINGITPKAQTTLFSRIAGYVISSITVQETVEDWRYHFAELQTTPDSVLRGMLHIQIQEKMEVLVSDLAVLEKEMISEVKLLDEKIEFLEEKITAEKNKTGIISKRFKSLDELYDFELKLRKFKATEPEAEPEPEPVPEPVVQQPPAVNVVIEPVVKNEEKGLMHQEEDARSMVMAIG